MSAAFTRIIGGLNERVVMPFDESFRARRFSVSRHESGWSIEPGLDGQVVMLDHEVISIRRAIRDDDLLSTNMDWWVFHDGNVARDEALERAALERGGPHWEVLADWLAERGDPLGERINAHHGVTKHPPPLTLESMWRVNDLGEHEEHGVVTRLIARWGVEEAHVLAALALRRMRFLQHLVIDASPARVSSWVSLLESSPLPRWLETISFGDFLGAGTRVESPSKRLKAMCPRLRDEPMVRWNAKPTLTLESHSDRVDGLAPGATMAVRTGLRIEPRGERVVIHDGASQSSAFAEFALEAHHCVLIPTVGGSTPEDWMEGSRLRLLHGDLIEVAPGVLFRFRLRD